MTQTLVKFNQITTLSCLKSMFFSQVCRGHSPTSYIQYFPTRPINLQVYVYTIFSGKKRDLQYI